jgi:hypothetical protein
MLVLVLGLSLWLVQLVLSNIPNWVSPKLDGLLPRYSSLKSLAFTVA